jgi:thymidylate kinase
VTTTESGVRIVAVVGIDGAGKTTQARQLARWLTAHGHSADYWQNAGGRRWLDRAARRIGLRDAQAVLGTGGMLLVESVLRWLAIARALLGSRRHGRIAIMDRYSYCQYASIRARGGGHGGRRREWLARRLYRPFDEPDLTVFLSVPPGRAYARVEARGTDHEDPDHLAAADAAYRSLPEAARFVVIDGDRRFGAVQRDLRRAVAALLPDLHAAALADPEPAAPDDPDLVGPDLAGLAAPDPAGLAGPDPESLNPPARRPIVGA